MSLETEIYEHCLGSESPQQNLLEFGKLPKGWGDRYLSLLEKAQLKWGSKDMVPRKVMSSIHFTSFYLNIRYEVWKSDFNSENLETEQELLNIRTPSEVFILG